MRLFFILVGLLGLSACNGRADIPSLTPAEKAAAYNANVERVRLVTTGCGLPADSVYAVSGTEYDLAEDFVEFQTDESVAWADDCIQRGLKALTTIQECDLWPHVHPGRDGQVVYQLSFGILDSQAQIAGDRCLRERGIPVPAQVIN